MTDLGARATSLLDRHTAPEILVLPDVWDVVSARVVTATDGVRALATARVARVSTGPFTQRVALTARQDAAAAIVAGGVLPRTTRPPD